MRGERRVRQGDWLPVREARDRILSAIVPVGTEVVPLPALLGRVLAETIVSPIDHPPWDNSAMDGYAVRSVDIQGAGPDLPIELQVVDDIPAGSFPTRPIGPGEAARIMTGAPVPVGSDSVIRVEDTGRLIDQTGSELADRMEVGGVIGSRIEILSNSDTLRNIRLRGEDLRRDTEILEPGQLLRPQEIGLLAQVGRREALVRRRPRVAILATGDELVGLESFDEVLAGRRIIDSNTPMLAAALIAAGCEPVPLGIAADGHASLRSHLEAAEGADALITTAGASVGEFDLVKDVLEELGYEQSFWRVAMRPGSPFSFGKLGGLPIFGVAGNPVSALVTFEVLVRPALRRLLGQTDLETPTLRVEVGERVPGAGDLTHFVRVRLEGDGRGGWTAWLTGPQGSGILTSTVEATALLIVPAGMGPLVPGSSAEAVPLTVGGIPCTTPAIADGAALQG